MGQLTAVFTGKVVSRTKRQVKETLEIATLVIEVVDGNPMYSQTIPTEWINDKTDLVKPFPVGSEVTATVNIRGREWKSPEGKTKYFLSFEGWKIEAANQAPAQPAVQEAEVVADSYDDLPW